MRSFSLCAEMSNFKAAYWYRRSSTYMTVTWCTLTELLHIVTPPSMPFTSDILLFERHQ